MFEPGQPWYQWTPGEIHAAGYGLMEGIMFWKRRVTPYDLVDTLPLSPQWKTDIKEHYHYYRTAFEIPETLAVIAIAGYYLVNHVDTLVSWALSFYGGI